jgi:hypothetical protein
MQAASPARVPEAAVARLAKLLAYIGEVVRLDERPAFRLADHRLATGQRLVLHRHETPICQASRSICPTTMARSGSGSSG